MLGKVRAQGPGQTCSGKMAHMAGDSRCCATISRMTSGVHSAGGAPWWPSTCTSGASVRAHRLRAGEQARGRWAGCLSGHASLPRLLVSDCARCAAMQHRPVSHVCAGALPAGCGRRGWLSARTSPGLLPPITPPFHPQVRRPDAVRQARLVVEALTPPGVLLPPGARGGGVVAGGRGDRHVRVGRRVAKLLPRLRRHALYSQPCARGAHCLRAPILTQNA